MQFMVKYGWLTALLAAVVIATGIAPASCGNDIYICAYSCPQCIEDTWDIRTQMFKNGGNSPDSVQCCKESCGGGDFGLPPAPDMGGSEGSDAGCAPGAHPLLQNHPNTWCGSWETANAVNTAFCKIQANVPDFVTFRAMAANDPKAINFAVCMDAESRKSGVAMGGGQQSLPDWMALLRCMEGYDQALRRGATTPWFYFIGNQEPVPPAGNPLDKCGFEFNQCSWEAVPFGCCAAKFAEPGTECRYVDNAMACDVESCPKSPGIRVGYMSCTGLCK